MFGHNDDNQQQVDAAAAPAAADSGTSAASTDWQHPGSPITNTPAPASSSPAAAADPAPATAPAPAPTADNNVIKPTPTLDSGSGSDTALAPKDLLELKQEALGQLSPLVGHLDQSPEERFRTLMMMIQASDDQSLLKEAYATAQKITDEKTKAQALLDVVNEINYFTQQHKN